MPYPSLLQPEALPLQQSTADPYLYRRYSNTVLSQSLWGIIYGSIQDYTVEVTNTFKGLALIDRVSE